MRKVFISLIILILTITACGKQEMNGKITLLDHEGNEVLFPQDKPTVFFFMTTYT
jgi:hypothetical protein